MHKLENQPGHLKKIFQARPKTQHWLNWFENWTELVCSGMSIDDALNLSHQVLLMHSQNQPLAHCIEKISERLKQGDSLVNAFMQSGYSVPIEILLALECAQHSGHVQHVFPEHLRRWKACRKAHAELIQSLAYPIMVLSLSILCWLFLQQNMNSLVTTHSETNFQLSTGDTFLILGFLLFSLTTVLHWHTNSKKKKLQTLMSTGWSPAQAWYTSTFFFAIEQEIRSGHDFIYCLRQRPARFRFATKGLKKRHQLLNQFVARLNRAIRDGANFSSAMIIANAPEFMQRQAKLAEQTGQLATVFEMGSRVFELEARTRQRRLKTMLGPITLMIAALTLAMAYQSSIAPFYQNLSSF